jgi:N-methylhydantoinase A
LPAARGAVYCPARNMPSYAIGIDIGGTFTDCFITDGVHSWRGKAPTTPRALVDGLVAALEVTAAEADVALDRVLGEAVHFGLGTTAVTNCLAQQAGAATGLLVTHGFADLWPMARGHRLGHDGMSEPLPVLVPRRRIGEVRERVDRHGRVLMRLDEAAVETTVDHLIEAEGVESLAVCLLWSFRNPEHEQRVREIVARRRPGLHVSCSADLFPVVREYERMTTAVLNAYTYRSFAQFMDAVERRLRGAGLAVPIAVMQSNGGTFSPDEARAKPVFLAQSGPVAGVAAAQALSSRLGLSDVITGDMGGTSFDVAVIHGGAAARQVRAELFGLRTGMAMVAVRSIGAGGGSVASADARGVLAVGPESVGADPGPACYGRGGNVPAVTDALVALGLIDPRNFLGGRFLLDAESAIAALGRLGAQVGIDAEATACGVYRLACEQMMLAVKGLLVERGLDPRRFTLFIYGGCGPLFGAPIAHALGIGRVVVPGLSAVFSAYGAATADVRRELVRSVLWPLPVKAADLAATFAALEAELRQTMQAEGVGAERFSLEREVDMCFRKQTWEVTLPLPTLDSLGTERLEPAFRARYAELYGVGALSTTSAIELVNCRVIGRGRVPRPVQVEAPSVGVDPAPALRGARTTWLPGAGAARLRVPVYDGERLASGMTIGGPALIERRDTTMLVPSGDRAQVDGLGSLVIEVVDA